MWILVWQWPPRISSLDPHGFAQIWSEMNSNLKFKERKSKEVKRLVVCCFIITTRHLPGRRQGRCCPSWWRRSPPELPCPRCQSKPPPPPCRCHKEDVVQVDDEDLDSNLLVLCLHPQDLLLYLLAQLEVDLLLYLLALRLDEGLLVADRLLLWLLWLVLEYWPCRHQSMVLYPGK